MHDNPSPPAARTSVSVVLPSKDEAASLESLLPEIKAAVGPIEIIVVDDGSSDDTAEVCAAHHVVRVARPYAGGNGAAIKAGARSAKGETIVFMDADGQHDPKDILALLAKIDEGFDMVVGARSDATQANRTRRLANSFYNAFASWMTDQHVADLTSGFRAVRADRFREFLHLLPNGFSYPTSITMAFFRSGYTVAYVPIDARRRVGTSHIRPLRDGVRFLLIIFKVGTLFSPMKIFLPFSIAFFSAGLARYLYTFFEFGRFTNMSALLLMNAVLIFLIGLISEQITTLIFINAGKKDG